MNINDFWRKLNELDLKLSEVEDYYSINLLTKKILNTNTNKICNQIDTGNSTIGKRVELMKKNGKNSSFSMNTIIKIARSAY